MKKQNLLHHRILVSFTVLLIVSLACGTGPVEVVPPTSTPAPTVTPQPTPTPLPTQEPVPSVSALSAATVQILALLGGEILWTGSGTIISADGLILTNAHVASPHSPGLATFYNDIDMVLSPEPDALVVALVEEASKPPELKYIAEVVTADGALDLALIQIGWDIEGEPVNKGTLALPFVELGDSDQVQLGESVRIFGFPGIGGETITFTRGTVSGFESQSNVGDSAFIKTDSEIAPGNSGGLAVNEAGQIIGVPTLIVSDTGSVIGRLRPINFARPLIEAGSSYRSEYAVDGTGQETFTLTTWAEDYDNNECPVGPLERYKSGALAVVSVWSYEQMADGEDFLVLYYNGQEFLTSSLWAWEYGASDECFALSLHNSGQPLPDGDYRIEVFAGKDFPLLGAANTTIGPVQTGDIKLDCFVYDSLTNNGIADAAFIVLNPGVDIGEWINNPTDTDIYAGGLTDSSGNCTIPATLERLVDYPIVVAVEGYSIRGFYWRFGETDPAGMTLSVPLDPP